MNKKRFAVLAALILIPLASAFFVYSSVARIGPYWTTNNAFDSTNAGQIGGETKIFLAGDSVRVGQVVYIFAKNTVKASGTIANYNAIAGVVVGGTRTGMQGSLSIGDTSTLAATLGQRALVLRRGRTYILNGAGGGIAPGANVSPGSSGVGRAVASGATIDTLYRVFAKAVDTILVSKAGLAEVNVRP